MGNPDGHPETNNGSFILAFQDETDLSVMLGQPSSGERASERLVGQSSTDIEAYFEPQLQSDMNKYNFLKHKVI